MSTSKINPQAEALNKIIQKDNPTIYDLLSEKGRAIYFPKEGILAQTAEARETKLNATIGIALDDDLSPTRLSAIADRINLPPKDIFPYAPSFGKMELRQAWLQEIKRKNPSLKGKISLPIVTHAITHALSMVGYLFINPNDIIILADKFWGNYRLIFEQAYGGKLNTFNTFKNGGFDTDSFDRKLDGSKTKKNVILFNFPNNPSGYTPTILEAQKLVKIIKKYADLGKEILVILDDAYFDHVYKKGIYTQSLISLISHISPRILTVKVDGATKELYAWGLRVGFITFATKNITPEICQALENKTAGAIRGNISSASNLSQSLILHALSSPSYKKDKQKNYQLLKSRFEEVEKVLQNPKYSPYFSYLPYNSGYFMCLELKIGLDAETLRQTLIKKYSTGVISIGNLLRIAYSSVPKKDLKTLFENIYQVCRGQISL